LTPDQTADVLSFVLKSSKYAAGSTPLANKMDALLTIQLDAPK
jgi:hypothetical protein